METAPHGIGISAGKHHRPGRQSSTGGLGPRTRIHVPVLRNIQAAHNAVSAVATTRRAIWLAVCIPRNRITPRLPAAFRPVENQSVSDSSQPSSAARTCLASIHHHERERPRGSLFFCFFFFFFLLLSSFSSTCGLSTTPMTKRLARSCRLWRSTTVTWLRRHRAMAVRRVHNPLIRCPTRAASGSRRRQKADRVPAATGPAQRRFSEDEFLQVVEGLHAADHPRGQRAPTRSTRTDATGPRYFVSLGKRKSGADSVRGRTLRSTSICNDVPRCDVR